MASQNYHQGGLNKHCRDTEISHLFPSEGHEFAVIDHAATNVTGEKEVICFAVWYSDGIKAWEVPEIAVGISYQKYLL
jgi:hypothetical protein